MDKSRADTKTEETLSRGAGIEQRWREFRYAGEEITNQNQLRSDRKPEDIKEKFLIVTQLKPNKAQSNVTELKSVY